MGTQSIGYGCRMHPNLATQTSSHLIAFWRRVKPMLLSWSQPVTLVKLKLVVHLDFLHTSPACNGAVVI